MQFKVRRILPENIKNEIQKIGFSPSYLNFGVLKHKFLNIKVYNLKPEAATIIKQTALASNCDAAVHKGVLDHSIPLSDVILSGTVNQLRTTAEKLKLQQFSLNTAAEEILKEVERFEREDVSNISKSFSPKIMGVLNITEDSFSDGGRFLDPKAAIEHCFQMIQEGAEIIDIGAESTRPGAEIISSETEINRITPIIKELGRDSKIQNIKISIDTRNAHTARVMADFGADIINDVSGLKYDPDMINAVRETGLNVVIMHSRGTPKDMDNLSKYNDVIEEVYFELQERVKKAADSGILPDKIIIDPGFGFAKNNEQNFEIVKRIEEFKSLGFPILAGLSRKRFIKSVVTDVSKDSQKVPDNEVLDDLTSQLSFYFTYKKIDIIRVHNVAKTRQAVNLARRII